MCDSAISSVKSLFGASGETKGALAPRKEAKFKGVAAKFQQQACAISA